MAHRQNEYRTYRFLEFSRLFGEVAGELTELPALSISPNVFNGTFTVYRSAYNDPLFRGKLLVNDGLYELTSRTVPACTDNVHSQVIPSHKLEKLGAVVESNNFPSYNISVSAWHKRYAHMYVRGLKQLAQNDDVKGIEFSSPVKDITCDVCNISKSTRASYKSTGKSVMDFPLD
uniref:GAG-pre-integrase domain-containing protein n=1 Tax=Strigamia maritima TaxID=126957 RepID=T1JKW5_STRMM